MSAVPGLGTFLRKGDKPLRFLWWVIAGLIGMGAALGTWSKGIDDQVTQNKYDIQLVQAERKLEASDARARWEWSSYVLAQLASKNGVTVPALPR